MTERLARCACGALQVACRGEPARVSMCHCEDCQRRTGSAFGVAVFYPSDAVTTEGASRSWSRPSLAGPPVTFHFCPECGSSVWWEAARLPGRIAVALGAFADPDFPAPEQSVWTRDKHRWIALPADTVAHDVTRPLKDLAMSFDTPLVLRGPLRQPRQMLADQEYGGHASIHDDAMAEKLGFRAGPIEGPTHFSLFPPLLEKIWGQAWYERGCISSHYLNMVVEGEEVRAFAEMPAPGATSTRVWAEKADGTPVLEASASLGPDHGQTLLEGRMAALRPPERLLILADLKVGMKGADDEHVRMDPDQNMGALYPFSLNQKLAKITETSPWYSDGASNPWGRAIIPLEMVSVLAEYSSRLARFPVKGPAVGLFADQEIRMIDGPLFVGEDYLIRREIAALAESRRTESYWVRTRIFDAAGKAPKAEMLLNHATLKDSYAGYATAAQS